MISSDRPFEYTSAVSQVFMPTEAEVSKQQQGRQGGQDWVVVTFVCVLK